MRRAALLVALLGALIAGFIVVKQHRQSGATCDVGFTPIGTRCIPENCPSPLALQNGICDAPDSKIEIPETSFVLGPSDWEAEGRVSPRNVHVKKFRIDAFEATIGHVQHATTDAARAASQISRADAESFCESHGGRLPTEDEWLAAAAGEKTRRYPWGDTGAVCRRAAWGLASGPCAQHADGPDSVGSHASGDTPNGIHDLAGNVSEWVQSPNETQGVILGGSYETALATELRTWERRRVNPDAREKTIGFRCAYDLP